MPIPDEIFRKLLYQARRIPQYPYREYFLRRLKDHKQELSTIEWNKEKERETEEMLAQLKRIVKVQQLYPSEPLVIEKGKQ